MISEKKRGKMNRQAYTRARLLRLVRYVRHVRSVKHYEWHPKPRTIEDIMRQLTEQTFRTIVRIITEKIEQSYKRTVSKKETVVVTLRYARTYHSARTFP